MDLEQVKVLKFETKSMSQKGKLMKTFVSKLQILFFKAPIMQEKILPENGPASKDA